jgi:hypothetical protein
MICGCSNRSYGKDVYTRYKLVMQYELSESDAGLRAMVKHTERSQRVLREEGERLHRFVVGIRAVVRACSSTSTVTLPLMC